MPHPPSSFSLFLGDCQIGRVTYEDSNIPNVFGRLRVDEALVRPTTPMNAKNGTFLIMEFEN